MTKISVVIPLLNEEEYIDDLLSFLETSEPKQKEIFFVDGGSTDNTLSMINSRNLSFNYAIIHNKHQTVPFALNLAIPKCSGEIIVRLDGHTAYHKGYFLAILNAFEKSGADIVGGPMRIKSESYFQELVGIATSSMFGIGNSRFHFPDYEGETDSVYLGAWKKTIFPQIGLFDEGLKRNQDDEFHYRAKNAGLKIYQDPNIISYYRPRKELRKLVKQYYQYGYFKPMVLKKVNSEIKIRHLIPPLFALYLILLPALLFFSGLWSLPLLAYVGLNISLAFHYSPMKIRFLSLSSVFVGLHLSYGTGFLLGLLSKK